LPDTLSLDGEKVPKGAVRWHERRGERRIERRRLKESWVGLPRRSGRSRPSGERR